MTEAIHVHVHVEGLVEVVDILRREVLPQLAALRRQNRDEMAAIDDLAVEVAADTEVDTAAMTLLDGLHQALLDAIASGNPARLQQLADQLGQNRNALAASILKNTVSEGTPPGS